MNKELEKRIRDNIGANILIDYDEKNREIAYHQVRLMKATEIVELDKKIESNKKVIEEENKVKEEKLLLEQKEIEQKQIEYEEEQKFMNKYSLQKFITVYNFIMLKGLVDDESFFVKDISYLFKMDRSIERSKKIKEFVESNENFKKIYESVGGE